MSFVRLGGVGIAIALTACPASEPHKRPRRVETTSEDPPVAVSLVTPASASASPTPSASASVSAHLPGKLRQLPPEACVVPPVRPSDLTIRYQRDNGLPHHGQPHVREGIELHAEADCPALSGPRAELEKLSCKKLSVEELTNLYIEIANGGFQKLRHVQPAQGVSPHYGSRSVTLIHGDMACSFADSRSGQPDAASDAAFSAIVAAIMARI